MSCCTTTLGVVSVEGPLARRDIRQVTAGALSSVVQIWKFEEATRLVLKSPSWAGTSVIDDSTKEFTPMCVLSFA